MIFVLREFVLNSRHPGPRREKWGWERRPLRHFGRITGISGISGRVPRGHFLCAGIVKWTHLLGIGRPIFDKSKKIALFTPRRPKGPPRDPRGTPEGPPREPRGTPKGPPMDPMGFPRDPRGAPKGPRAAQREPSEPQIQAKGSQSRATGNQNNPRGQTISTNSRSTACAAVMLI